MPQLLALLPHGFGEDRCQLLLDLLVSRGVVRKFEVEARSYWQLN